MQLSKLEIQIIEILSQDARMDSARIAIMTGCSQAEATQAIETLEAAGVICGYPALINWDKTPREFVQAVIEVRVSPVRGLGFDAIAEQMLGFEEVESLYLMSGSYDLLLELRAKNLKELAFFVSERLAPMENVLSTATHFVLKKYKNQGITFNQQEDKRQAVSQ